MNEFFDRLKQEFDVSKAEPQRLFIEKICLKDMAYYPTVPLSFIVHWLGLFKSLEGYKVTAVNLTNVLDHKTNPSRSIATLEIRVEQ